MHLGARVGVIGDVHALDRRLEQAFTTLAAWGAEQVLQVGDILDGEGDPERTIELLQTHDAIVVSGNHDRWFLEGHKREKEGRTQSLSPNGRRYIESLPATRKLDTSAGGLLLCHGVGDDDMCMLRPETRGYGLQSISTLRPLFEDPSISFMVCGHTHERMVRRFQGLTVLNAGTLHDTGPCGVIGLDFGTMEMTCWDWNGDFVHVGAVPFG